MCLTEVDARRGEDVCSGFRERRVAGAWTPTCCSLRK
jgi:hypothetical protein